MYFDTKGLNDSCSVQAPRVVCYAAPFTADHFRSASHSPPSAGRRLTTMLTTTEFRSHWIDSAGRCYAQRHPFRTGQLQPVVNLDEVRAWIDLATSDAMLRIGFPGGSHDAAVHYLRFVLERGAETDDHLAAETARELCDHVRLSRPDGGGQLLPQRHSYLRVVLLAVLTGTTRAIPALCCQ
jgi:hypothetical protein